MREEEAGTRYLSPLVKQDLAKLDSDGESRRLALKSLKQFIDQLDATSMPKFLAQIAESREAGGSRSYAISLYEEVARVHRKLIRPHLPRVMSSLIRALAASGSSPQLQQACAKVTAAMARYTIDPTMSIEDAEEIIREICDPLAESLAGKLEPVAAGAAACIHALIETENWKYACDETVQEVCHRTTVALSEKSTRTLFHLQLASALASMNPDTLGFYGATLLRVGEEILKTAVDSWQHRKAAAKLLQGVLTILDQETVETEIDLAIHALESCRLDKMPHVRAAVSEALYVAKMLASGDSTQSCVALSSPLCKSMDQNRSTWIKGDVEQSHSPWTKGDVMSSPVQKRIVSPTSQESNQLSFSPASTSTMESMHIRQISTPARSYSRRSKQTPLYPARGMGFKRSPRCGSPGTLSPSNSSTDECEFASQKLDAKENMAARITNVNGALTSEEFGHVQVQVKTIRVPVPFTDAFSPVTSSLQLNKYGVDIITPESEDRASLENFVDRSSPHAGNERSIVSNSMISRQMMSPMVSAILDELTETASSILAEDDAGLALLDSQIEEASILKPNFNDVVLPRLRLGCVKCPGSLTRSGHAANAQNSNQSFTSSTMQLNEKSPGNIIRIANGCNLNNKTEGYAEVETRDMNMAATETAEDFTAGIKGSAAKSLRRSSPHDQVNDQVKHPYNSLAHLDFSPEKSKSLITTDFLPFATPKRLMRALQSLNSPNPNSRRVALNQDMAPSQSDAVPSVVDMDVETSSEAGWSVRDNPIASDGSFEAESSDEDELEDRQKLPTQLVQNVLSTDCVTPRDIQMLSPVCRKPRSTNGAGSGLHQENTNDLSFNRTPCISTTPTSTQAHNCRKCDYTCVSCISDIHRSTSGEEYAFIPVVEDSNIDSVKRLSSGLGDAIHEDEVKMNALCCECVAKSEDFTRDKESRSKECYRHKSSEENSQRWWDRLGLGQYMLVRLVSRNWRNLCWHGEVVLGGTLCLVLTLPIAMALAKALSSPPDRLVPT